MVKEAGTTTQCEACGIAAGELQRAYFDFVAEDLRQAELCRRCWHRPYKEIVPELRARRASIVPKAAERPAPPPTLADFDRAVREWLEPRLPAELRVVTDSGQCNLETPCFVIWILRRTDGGEEQVLEMLHDVALPSRECLEDVIDRLSCVQMKGPTR